MKRTLKILILLTLLTTMVSAHEFWLEAKREGPRLAIQRWVGEGFEGILWAGSSDPSKVFKFDHYYAGGSQRVVGARISPRLGDNLVAFHNKNTFIEIAPDVFNGYLRDDGLDNALEYRTQKGILDKPGREFYQRCVKTLVRSGSKGDDTYATNTGMPVELIPGSDPLDRGKSLEFTVLFNNQPYKNALVQVWHRSGGRTEVVKFRSDEAGKVTFPIWPEGDWMVSTVRIVPAKGKADWQSYWGSYTFSY